MADSSLGGSDEDGSAGDGKQENLIGRLETNKRDGIHAKSSIAASCKRCCPARTLLLILCFPFFDSRAVKVGMVGDSGVGT